VERPRWNIAQYIFFSPVHGTFSKKDHMLGQKASLNTYKKTEIPPCILSDYIAIKPELNNTRQIQGIISSFGNTKDCK
jgi:hypothetical protein